MGTEDRPSWLRDLVTRVDQLWDWMHTHDAEISAWWKEQRLKNKDLEARLNEHTDKLHALDLKVGTLGIRLGFISALGAIVGGGLVTWLLGR